MIRPRAAPLGGIPFLLATEGTLWVAAVPAVAPGTRWEVVAKCHWSEHLLPAGKANRVLRADVRVGDSPQPVKIGQSPS